MHHPYYRQKIFEARAHELERIAADDRKAKPHTTTTPRTKRRRWSLLRLVTRRVVHR
jgi:hypothetical protein